MALFGRYFKLAGMNFFEVQLCICWHLIAKAHSTALCMSQVASYPCGTTKHMGTVHTLHLRVCGRLPRGVCVSVQDNDVLELFCRSWHLVTEYTQSSHRVRKRRELAQIHAAWPPVRDKRPPPITRPYWERVAVWRDYTPYNRV